MSHDMRKKTLLALFIPIFAISLNACGESAETLIADTSEMHFKNQVKGTAFDATGLKVYFQKGDRNGRIGRREVEYTIDAPEIIDPQPDHQHQQHRYRRNRGLRQPDVD